MTNLSYENVKIHPTHTHTNLKIHSPMIFFPPSVIPISTYGMQHDTSIYYSNFPKSVDIANQNGCLNCTGMHQMCVKLYDRLRQK